MNANAATATTSRSRTLRIGAALVAAAGLTAVSQPTLAQDAGRGGDELVFEIGAGARYQPKYDGASNYLLVPFPILKLSYLKLPGLGTIADDSTQGLSIYPSFGFVGSRSASDDASLTGLNSIDWALEIGAGVGYSNDYFRAFGETRRGFNGHEGFVGELGVDAILHPMDRVTVNIGPRLGLADSEYMDTYFGISAAESIASGLPQYKASGGIKDVGLAAKVSYAWTDNATVYLDGSYKRLVGDAADSPIVKNGEANQFTVGLGMSYRFSFDLDGQ